MTILAQIKSTAPLKVLGEECAGCVQEYIGERFVPADGLGTNKVLLLGDSPWKEEAAQGRPFVGASGRTLDKAFRALRTDRKNFLIANSSIWCKPPQLGWSDNPDAFAEARAAIHQCAPHLDRLVEKYKPKAIVTLGGAALRRLTGLTSVDDNQCYVHDSCYGIPAVATYHPSYINRGKFHLTTSLIYAIDKALSIAKGTSAAEDEDELLLDPPIDEAKAYLESGLVEGRFPRLFVDIETPLATMGRKKKEIDTEDRWYTTRGEMGASYNILRVGLSHRKNSALTVPWAAPYVDLIKWALEHADLLIEHAHNHYDARRLKANGCSFGGPWASSMHLWHYWQPHLDKGLEWIAPFFFNGPPWKHLSSIEPAKYNAKDVCRTVDAYLSCESAVKAQGGWDGFWNSVVRFDNEILSLSNVGTLPLDAEKQASFVAELTEEVKREEAALCAAVPPSARKITIKQRKPKDSEGYVEVELPVEIKKWRKKKEAKADCATCQGKGVVVEPNGVAGRGKRCADCLSYTETVAKLVWRKEEFNPGSSNQTKELIKALDLAIPKGRNSKGEWAETTGTKQLQRLAKKHPEFKKIIEVREAKKIKDSYSPTKDPKGICGNWKIDPDGCVRGFYGFSPSTLRLNCWFDNLQTLPSRKRLAAKWREQAVAPAGYIFGEVDSSGIEAVLVGYFAGSERYVRLAKAGVHGYLTAARLGTPIDINLPFDELQRLCKRAKKDNHKLYNTCKPIVHGSNYLITPFGVFTNNPEEFDSVDEADGLQRLYFSTEAGKDVRKWQEETLRRVARERYLQNPWGLRQYFFHIYKQAADGEWVVDHSGEAKEAIAALPQSSAAFCQREYALNLIDRFPSMAEFLRLFTHDSILLCYPESLGEDPTRTLAQVMMEPVARLDGLAIGAEAKVGHTLAEMEEIKL